MILDAEGRGVITDLRSRVDVVERKLAEEMTAALLGVGPEQRVEALRESVLGVEPRRGWVGLDAWLPKVAG